MIKDLQSHFFHYLILLIILLLGGVVFVNQPDKIIKFQVSSITAIAYILWGILHHLAEKNLNWKIVVEYSLIGLLSIVLLGGALL